MKHSRKCTKTSNGNKHNISKSTSENPMYTPKMYTSHERTNIQIPKTSKIYEYLYVYTDHDTRAKWERLDAILELAEQNMEMYAIRIFDDFLARMSVFFPGKIEDLDKLRPLIIKHILNGCELDESYYKLLREL